MTEVCFTTSLSRSKVKGGIVMGQPELENADLTAIHVLHTRLGVA